MTGKKFFIAVANSKADVVQIMLDILRKTGSSYCVVGGLAVNAYAEPVVSLDLDLVVNEQDLNEVCKEAKARGFRIEKFEHSINLTRVGSDLRIQFQTDPRYQEFVPRAKRKRILGYEMKIAAVEDVLKGKTWAYLDEKRRKSKRQKDLADIIRIIEVYPGLRRQLPYKVGKFLT